MPTKDETYIKVRCTPAQKAQIEAKARAVKAKSVNEYCLTTLLDGKTEEYGSLRRKAEGALANAQTYWQLCQLNQNLHQQQQQNAVEHQSIQHAISLLEQIRQQRDETALDTQIYEQLCQLTQVLQQGQSQNPAKHQSIQQAIALVEEIGREMVLARLASRVEEVTG